MMMGREIIIITHEIAHKSTWNQRQIIAQFKNYQQRPIQCKKCAAMASGRNISAHNTTQASTKWKKIQHNTLTITSSMI
jgi:hypothetical protein